MGQLVMDQTVHMKYLYIKSIVTLHVICNKYTIKCILYNNYYIYQNFNHSQVKFFYSTDMFSLHLQIYVLYAGSNFI